MNVECVLLAGGKNSRYGGRNKAFVEVQAKRIIDRNIEVLQEIFPQIRIVANDTELFHEFSFPLTSDIYKEIGPVGGIHAALTTSESEAVFIFSCDMPFLSEDIIRKMIDRFAQCECDALVPKLGNKVEPMHAIYRTALLPRLEQYIKEDAKRSVYGFLKNTETAFISFDAHDSVVRKAFTNINSPSDLTFLTDY
jgi:molybdopterin-guanine dinucleotide biosynthesis protein A